MAEKQTAHIAGLKPGEECSPGCKRHLSHPCEKCGRYAAGMLDAKKAAALSPRAAIHKAEGKS